MPRYPSLSTVLLFTSMRAAEPSRDSSRIQADVRWGNADETIVSLEILTVLIGGPLAFYIAYLLAADSPARHPWLLILSTGELYGG